MMIPWTIALLALATTSCSRCSYAFSTRGLNSVSTHGTGTNHRGRFLNDQVIRMTDPIRSSAMSMTSTNNECYFAKTTDDDSSKPKTVVVAGASGYIGKAVVQESVRRGHDTIALVRSLAKIESEEGQYAYGKEFKGAKIVEMDVSDANALADFMANYDGDIDTIVSCLASPVGTKKEAYTIDYQATLNCMNAGRDERVKSRHFILLSAYCVQKPLLQLQQAKLKFEAKLREQTDMTWSIVRPTAFFKSVSGQLEGIQKGNPYVLFGDGAVTRCNPIAESELAEFMLDSMTNEEKQNKIMNIGGPDKPLTNQMLGEMMFKAIGQEEHKFVYAPTWIFDSIINTLQVFATLLKSEALEDAAEYGRIGKYYAVEDMLTTKPEEKYGKITMQDHYNFIASKGQDPFTPIRATAFIGRFLQAVPVIGTAALPIGYIVSHPELANADGLDISTSILVQYQTLIASISETI